MDSKTKKNLTRTVYGRSTQEIRKKRCQLLSTVQRKDSISSKKKPIIHLKTKPFMIEKTASRIFQEMPLIERLLNKSIDTYNPTGDEGLDKRLREALREEVPARADGFVMCLRDIAQDMTFDEWQDFWLDMGIRIFNAEEEWHTDSTDLFSLTEITDITEI